MSGFLSGFEHPERLFLLLLLLLLIVGYIIASRRQRFGMRYTNTGMLERILPRQSQWRRHAAVALSFLSLASIMVAFAKPTGETMVPREQATIVLVIDTSMSMQATDVKPNRLDAAKQAAVAFVQSVPEGYNIAVVKLSGNPGVVMPPSPNKTNVERVINSLQLEESTAIGDSISAALSAMTVQTDPGSDKPQVVPGAIVLLSDGENTTGTAPIQAAKDAAAAKVPIHTIAYGTENGYVDMDNERFKVPPDKELLAQLAEATGGKSYEAASADDLTSVYNDIRSEVAYEPAQREVTSRFVGISLIFAVVAGLGAIFLSARWP